MPSAVDLTGTREQIEALIAIAQRQGDAVETSEVSNLDASRALNAGIDLATAGAILSFVTIVFKTATAALEFMKAAREELKARKAAELVVSDPASGQAIGKLGGASSDAELARLSRSGAP
jgi:N-acyl-D-aspartate/D-glutamate deacylase